MKICDDCGELKPCRKRRHIWATGGNHLQYYPFIGFTSFDFVCDECIKAKDILAEKANIKRLKEDEKAKKEWIKERDKILNISSRCGARTDK